MAKRISYLILLLLFYPLASSADEYVDLIRVTCIPEMPHLSVERLVSHDASGFIRDTKGQKILRTHGLLPAYKFDYVCKFPETSDGPNTFPEVTFHIWGKEDPKKSCGGNADGAIISMTRNDKMIVDQVTLGQTCHYPSEGSVPIHINYIDIERHSPGDETLITSVSDNRHEIQLYNFKPILTQKKLECITSNKNFTLPGRDWVAMKECDLMRGIEYLNPL